MRPAILAASLCVLLGALAGLAPLRAWAELDEEQWRDAAKDARHLMKTPGELARKEQTVRKVAEDDSERAAKVLVDWAVASLKMKQTELEPAKKEAEDAYTRLEEMYARSKKVWPPNLANERPGYDKLVEDRDKARAHVADEEQALRALAAAFSRLRSPAAIDVLLQGGEKAVARREGSGRLLVGMARAYVEQPVERVTGPLLARLGEDVLPEVRIVVLEWMAVRRPAGAFEAAVQALGAKEEVVRRGATSVLRELDDPRAVEPLIGALAGADGTLADEVEAALWFYTGETFERDAATWSRWWAENGAKWLASPVQERFRGTPPSQQAKGGTTSFYGVETRSKRIVFVLDRSGSMEKPANPDETRRGPTTGQGGGGAEGKVEGSTKIEVARNQLAWSISSLPGSVVFGVIFFAQDVKVWKEPPELVPANAANKEAAKAWFKDIPAEGSTSTFDALQRALDYAGGPMGADTIFLLSDGSPTVPPGGELLEGEALETAYKDFLYRNRLYRCVVHTIGVGPTQNRVLMERIAKDTGGTYRAVGL